VVLHGEEVEYIEEEVLGGRSVKGRGITPWPFLFFLALFTNFVEDEFSEVVRNGKQRPSNTKNHSFGGCVICYEGATLLT
jgi:hypothetical protein